MATPAGVRVLRRRTVCRQPEVDILTTPRESDHPPWVMNTAILSGIVLPESGPLGCFILLKRRVDVDEFLGLLLAPYLELFPGLLPDGAVPDHR